jgi:hypothetical protein
LGARGRRGKPGGAQHARRQPAHRLDGDRDRQRRVQAGLPLASLRCDAAAEQAARRFTALVLVAGGTLYALAWLIAPLDWAFPFSITALGAATAAGVVRCLAARYRAT